MLFKRYLLLMFFIFLIIFLVLFLLYDFNDDVISLDNFIFYSIILGLQFVWNVEFYNSWCGYCINFVFIYKKVVIEMKGNYILN